MSEPMPASAGSFEQAISYARELSVLYRPDEPETSPQGDAATRRRIVRLLEDGGPSVVFQPIFSLATFVPVGVEALSRFPNDPDARSPYRWFDDAARVGLLPALEGAAVSAAVAAHVDSPDLYLSINVSPETLVRTSLTERLGSLQSTVVLEITEHAAVEDYRRLADVLSRFRAHGGMLAVDDAGAGFSSLRHILDLEPDIIKLDISLTRGIDGDRSRRALARALVAFAEETGATIVAEGIETERELAVLRGLGVSFGQGFRLARPMPEGSLNTLVGVD